MLTAAKAHVTKFILMKNQLIRILSFPLVQILSFCIILVGSPYFGGPYLYFVFGSFKEGYAYGILGMIGIVLTLISLFIKARGYMQVAGLIIMIASLVVFFFASSWKNAKVTLLNLTALATLVLFMVVCAAVYIKIFRWKNY